MKHLVLIGDGIADFPCEELDGRTPLEVAFTPSMDEVAATGLSGLFCPIPDDLPPGSAVGNLSLFGYDPHEAFAGRAPFEAANQGITLGSNQIAFRCNLVTLEGGVMCDFTSGHISTQEGTELVASLNANLREYPVIFSAGVSYRHLTIVSATGDLLGNLEDVKCTPPHDISGAPYVQHLPEGPGSDLLCRLMKASEPVLANHPVNAARIAAGKPPATSIWLWGQGRAPSMRTYADLFQIRGAVISAVDLVKGIGVCAGLEIINVPGATGYLDTNYAGKVSAALEALRWVDFVYLHVEAPDEASHEGRVAVKIRAIEDFDAYVVAPCLERVRKQRAFRLLVASDHVTALSTRTHAHGPVPFAACGAGIVPNDAKAFSERDAQGTGILIAQGHTLVPYFLRTDTVDLPALNHASK